MAYSRKEKISKLGDSFNFEIDLFMPDSLQASSLGVEKVAKGNPAICVSQDVFSISCNKGPVIYFSSGPYSLDTDNAILELLGADDPWARVLPTMEKKSTDHIVCRLSESYLFNISHFYNEQAMVKLLTTEITNKNALIKSPAALNGPLYDPSPIIQTNSSTCVLCEYVKDGHTEAQVKKTVEAICDRMPGVIKKECKNLVDTYEPAIVAFLVNEIEPAHVCPILHLCNEEDEGALLQGPGIISLNNNSNCEMCEFATYDER